LTEIDGFRIEAIPHGHMLVMRNRDVPGVIGRVGTILGEHNVNISSFNLGRRERGGDAMAVVEVDAALDDATLKELTALEPVISARQIEL
jgi:D-3-phosphoglycerate dehydrogenase